MIILHKSTVLSCCFSSVDSPRVPACFWTHTHLLRTLRKVYVLSAKIQRSLGSVLPSPFQKHLLKSYHGLARHWNYEDREIQLLTSRYIHKIAEMWYIYIIYGGFPDGSEIKESACNVGDPSSIPGSEKDPGGHGYPLQYSRLENSTDTGASWAITHGLTKSRTRVSD